MSVKKYTVLGLDQVYGDKRLDVFNRYGSEAEVTDYAISRGTEYYPIKGKYFNAKDLPKNSPLLDKKVCEYWTSTKVDGSAAKCYSYGRFGINKEVVWSDNNGIRIVIPFQDIKYEVTGSYSDDYGKGEVTTVLFGEYPQRVLDYSERHTMDRLFEKGELIPTGKYYPAWGYMNELFYDGIDRKFERDEYPEYEYNGKKYVKAKRAVFENDDNRTIWAVVEPIEWIIDKKTDLAITKKCIIGGIPLNRKGIYLGNFEDTLVQQFLDKEFTYDIGDNEIEFKKTDDRIDKTDFLI